MMPWYAPGNKVLRRFIYIKAVLMPGEEKFTGRRVGKISVR
jgi:hypothetical protein